MTTYRTQVTQHYTQADKAQGDYVYLPFRLPQPARRLHVVYAYSAAMSSDQVEGGNVVDLGLFDPHGHDFPGAAGFRGWSGSARREFFIELESATPGYLPGPLPAGDYHIILGLYRVWEAGVDVTATIEAELDPTLTEPGPLTVTLPPQTAHDAAEQATIWLKGDLQSHTHHSDAQCSVARLLEQTRAAGLDFLAVTDHNTVSHHPELQAASDGGLILIRGQECTTYFGHMNIWGTSRWCDFRCRDDAQIAAIIELAHASGALCSINHPKVGGPAWEFSTELPVDAMEVWQGPWPNRNTESLELWDRLLLQGRRLPLVGGSDYHCREEPPAHARIGNPTTWVKAAARDAASILGALQAGRASVSYAPNGPRLDIRAITATAKAGMGEPITTVDNEALQIEVDVQGGAGLTVVLIADGEVVHTQPIAQATTRVAASVTSTRYVRAEIVGDLPADQLPAAPEIDRHNWRWALSNPIYVRQAGD